MGLTNVKTVALHDVVQRHDDAGKDPAEEELKYPAAALVAVRLDCLSHARWMRTGVSEGTGVVGEQWIQVGFTYRRARGAL